MKKLILMLVGCLWGVAFLGLTGCATGYATKSGAGVNPDNVIMQK